ncbi:MULTISPECIES: PGPGW domain-containing protein [unclassified Hephaestia]|uniref:PGPGW domain-containing protein n=1 Tax=unclassified Hephaestia TaxID=2631281 RepID=UPI002076EAE9|nr:PGPGW domain-containing protein [Hephaestia sp. MAHUQ-44]MCM8729971.1 PGPGW domain-containing protein [Hephaestia sp. MAHUQ-44]
MSDQPDAPRRTPHPAIRIALLVAGTLLILSTPIIGPLPGPGGIFVFIGGLTLVLRNSRWARHRFARLKRRWPRLSEMADHGLRRRSFHRRRARDIELGLREPEPSLRERIKRRFVVRRNDKRSR